ncbi:hypothetical protein EKD16_04645 [Streptomonospora litoralis]|uniref:Uncharacterized protein n=1 Tax=Streptomonospora litoralis TaxID=2498135 RepID=A0A4P6PWX3_9ACTN|nr:hypothetical protein EKD16_04645 [Streptomonospora litoralis]
MRRRLANLDRLREVWAERRRYGYSADDPAVDRHSARRRVEALRTLAGQEAGPAAEVDAAEDAFVAMAQDCRAGVRLTPQYFESLAHGIPDFHPPLHIPEGIGTVLADAAAAETHAVIRAANLFLACADALDAAEGAAARHGAGPESSAEPGLGPGVEPLSTHLRPLPWWVAALSLMRSDLPPPAIDRRCPPPASPVVGGAPSAAGTAPGPVGPAQASAGPAVPPPRTAEDRLTPLVLLLADLEAAALRWELSRVSRAPVAGRSESGRLAAAVHRRIVEHLRLRCASLRLVLRELDPASRSVVSSSTGGSEYADPSDAPRPGAPQGGRATALAENSAVGRETAVATAATSGRGAVAPSVDERRDAAARRALFTPGADEWHAALDIDLADGVLQLLVFVQEVGSASTGVLAVTADGWMTTDDGAVDVLEPGCADCVTLVPTDGADDRWPEVEAFVDDVLARSIGHLTRTARY